MRILENVTHLALIYFVLQILISNNGSFNELSDCTVTSVLQFKTIQSFFFKRFRLISTLHNIDFFS